MDMNKYTRISELVTREVRANISDFADHLFTLDERAYANYDDFDNMVYDCCPYCGEKVDSDACMLSSDDPDYPEAQRRCPHCEHTFDEPETAYADILEYWLVTPWLGQQLRANGEATLKRYGNWIWGRTTSGQAIALDGVIERIARDNGIIEEEKRATKKYELRNIDAIADGDGWTWNDSTLLTTVELDERTDPAQYLLERADAAERDDYVVESYNEDSYELQYVVDGYRPIAALVPVQE